MAVLEKLLKEALDLSQGDKLFVLEQDSEDVKVLAQEIEKCAIKSSISITRYQISREQLSRDDYRPDFEDIFKEEPPNGIILLTDLTKETTPSRLTILQDLTNKGNPWRIASMPGVTFSHLQKQALDFDQIIEDSKYTFFALSISNSIRIYTENSTKTGLDFLEVPVQSMIPILSTGKIASARWGNYPSGECFVLPISFKAEGKVTLRGSFPFEVMDQNDWISFNLEKGRLIQKSIKSNKRSMKRRFESLFFTEGGKNIWKNSNALSEFGVGTNNGISELTGLPIFDEKIHGTFHLGIGGNKQFDGDIRCKTHFDLTFKNAYRVTSVVKGFGVEIPIIEKGKFVLKDTFNYSQLSNLKYFSIPANFFVMHTGIKVLQEGIQFRYSTVRDSSVVITVRNVPEDDLILISNVLDKYRSGKILSFRELLKLKTTSHDVFERVIKFLFLVGLLNKK